jgi:multidrug efflux pump subunit AcrA (membrane-fusion protein)
LQVKHIPAFKDIRWRWIAYVSSATLIAATVFAFFHEIELKQDVPCEIVSLSEVKIQGYSGMVSAIYKHPSEQVERGTPLFSLVPDSSLGTDSSQATAFDTRADRDVTVYAPQAGVLTSSSLLPGRTLSRAEVALVIMTAPAKPLIATLRIPSRQRGFIKPGQVIHIKLDAFPYARFGTYEARIDSISDTTLGAPALSPTAPEAQGRDDYLAWATLRSDSVDFGAEQFTILPGMRGRASIVVERRTIAEWVLAPLFRMIRG